jgi:hypothetical protein
LDDPESACLPEFKHQWLSIEQEREPDLLVVSVGDRARLYRNVAPGDHWVGVRVTDAARGNGDLLGAGVRVTVGGRACVQVVQSASSDLIDVTWPDGTRKALPGGPADRWMSLTPGRDKVQGAGVTR